MKLQQNKAICYEKSQLNMMQCTTTSRRVHDIQACEALCLIRCNRGDKLITIFKSDNWFNDQPMNVWSLKSYALSIHGDHYIRMTKFKSTTHLQVWSPIMLRWYIKIYTLQIFINITITRKNVYNYKSYCNKKYL